MSGCPVAPIVIASLLALSHLCHLLHTKAHASRSPLRPSKNFIISIRVSSGSILLIRSWPLILKTLSTGLLSNRVDLKQSQDEYPYFSQNSQCASSLLLPTPRFTNQYQNDDEALNFHVSPIHTPLTSAGEW